MAVSVAAPGGPAGSKVDEGRNRDARGESADGGGDGHGLFGEVDSRHGGKDGEEGIELAVGSDERKRGRSFESDARCLPSRSFPPALV